MFRKELVLTPKLCFAIALLYMASADSHIENEEITYLSTVLHGDVEVIRQANRYIKEAMKKGTNFDHFLKESDEILNESQKECIVINLIDMMLSDGQSDIHEEKLLYHILNHFGFDEQRFEIYKELMIKKNNHSVFEL